VKKLKKLNILLKRINYILSLLEKTKVYLLDKMDLEENVKIDLWKF